MHFQVLRYIIFGGNISPFRDFDEISTTNPRISPNSLMLKLLGTSELRNRDPTFYEIGTQWGPSAVKIGTRSDDFTDVKTFRDLRAEK